MSAESEELPEDEEERTRRRVKRVAEIIDNVLNLDAITDQGANRIGFAVLLFDCAADSEASYISNVEQDELLHHMRAIVAKYETPPSTQV